MSDTNIYYVYAYLRKTGTPYYIGKGCGNRAYVKHHKNAPLPKDLNRVTILESNLSESDAYTLEKQYIQMWGRKVDGGILRNITEGGAGGPRLAGELNGMYGKKRPKWIIDKAVKASTLTTKGKTYEEIHGVDKAKQLREDRSLKIRKAREKRPGNGTLNSNADHTEYTYYNVVTGEVVTATKLVMNSFYKITREALSAMDRGSTRSNWCLLINI